MPRGGQRPRADAPKGNTNALKSGRHSGRLKRVFTAMSHVPEVRDYFAMARRRPLRSEPKAASGLRVAILGLVKGSPAKDNHILAYRGRPGQIYSFTFVS